MPRDHTKLIYDVSELSGLFTDASSLEAFLGKTVGMIAAHMHCEVCSIYLYYEERRELVLTATYGLNPQAVGQVRLKIGEGLTGQAVKELRPVYSGHASTTPGYRYFPGIGEEVYESFLAVPIIRGQTRIGVMVVQNRQRDYFTEEDVKAFRAITSQLANTIETAKLLIHLNERRESVAELSEEPELKFVRGRVGSVGLAFSEAVVMEEGHLSPRRLAETAEGAYTLEDFLLAVRVTEQQLNQLQEEIEKKLSDVASLIFTAQILMLKDQPFIDAITAQIRQGVNPPVAIAAAVEVFVQKFDGLTNDYLREKRYDVMDIGNRLLENLLGRPDRRHELSGKIVIARELYPSDILRLSSKQVQGIVLLSGGITSHLSILARSLGLPVVISDEQRLLSIPSGTRLLLDAEQGNIYLHPESDVIEAFRRKEEAARQAALNAGLVKEQTCTRDGTRVHLLANINLLGDLKAATAHQAEGVGLYRTEFPFIVRSDFPSEEEQLVIYRKLIEGMPGREVTFRTLDIGGDKVLSYYNYGKEQNPFLGMRSIRFSLRHREIFQQQLRAILRAGPGTDLRIMFPMISSLDEFLEARAELRKAVADLQAEGEPCHASPRVGLMVELPAAVEIIDDLAAEADFFSIGTNDFIQYMLAVDRTNEKVAELYMPYHPAVLRALKRVAEAALRHGKEVSICGDMAHDERYMAFFLGIGVRKFSVDPLAIYRTQKRVMSLDMQEARRQAEQVLGLNLVRDTGPAFAAGKRPS